MDFVRTAIPCIILHSPFFSNITVLRTTHLCLLFSGGSQVTFMHLRELPLLEQLASGRG
jgi:hypothetical protein